VRDDVPIPTELVHEPGAATMSQAALRWTVCGLAGAMVALTSVSGPAQEKKAPPKVARQRVDPSAERVSGVIVKVEPIKSGAEPRGAVRLTINTAAVWRDWARDQVSAEGNQSPRKAAERGANSVATKGQPQDKDTLVVVQVSPDSKVETRFRTSTDEASKGASTPAAARDTGAGPKGRSPGARQQVARPVQYKAADLKTGLFIEADFRRAGGDNAVSTVAVIRPVSDTAPTEKPAGK